MALARLFREREIIVRSDEGVEYLRLSPVRQKLYAGAALLTLTALSFLSVLAVTSTSLSDVRDGGIALAETTYRRIVAVVTGRPGEAAIAMVPPRELTPEERIAELEERLEEALDENRRLAEERDRAEAEHKRLISSMTPADKRAAALAAQQEAIQELIDRARAALERTQKGVTRLGLDPDRLLAMAPPQPGTGGPFIEFRQTGRGHPAHSELVKLGDKLKRLTRLRQAVKQLPLGEPLKHYWVASSYGVRRDPFNNQMAMHNGIDLAAPKGTEIRTLASGRVTYAGRNGEYGKMVEIDHGFGLRTRYGHMSKILVRAGQKVAPHDKIGLVGSTGRSTAPHLHYEVRFRGRTLNPRKFVEAKQNVFQN